MADDAQGTTQEAEGGFWDRLVYRFWFLRGVVAAVSLSGLVPNFIPVTRFEFLAFFHAFVVAWNASLSVLIALLPDLGLPVLPAAFINVILLLSATTFPMFIQYLVILQKIHFPFNVFDRVFGILGLFCSFYIAYAAFDMSRDPVTVEFFSNNYVLVSSVVCMLASVFVFNCVWIPGFGMGVLSFIVFVVSMEVLYFLAGDVVAGIIRGLPEVVPPQ